MNIRNECQTHDGLHETYVRGARLICAMLIKGTEFTGQGQDYYEERYRQRALHHLAKRVEKLGLQLTPIPQAA